MARKPCGQDIPTLTLDCSFQCLPTGRFRRIAKNAILPFYYDNNNNKVFYIKNPTYYSGAEANNPGANVTQAMRYAHLARARSRHIAGRNSTRIVQNSNSCNIIANNSNWWGNLDNKSKQDDTLSTDKLLKCICDHTRNTPLKNN
tara:strand:- start:166 stop:600 length:435 start_codon:yes stop_codon:yes gene_type:complete